MNRLVIGASNFKFSNCFFQMATIQPYHNTRLSETWGPIFGVNARLKNYACFSQQKFM